MRVSDQLRCETFPCADVRHEVFAVAGIERDAPSVRVILVSETAPADPADGYEQGDDALFAKTTVLAFQEAGFAVATLDDVRSLGVHLTTAVKCGKLGSRISPSTIRACSNLLEQELALFPKASALLLMGDAAIRSLNEIARRNGEPRPVPAGSTYRVRGGEFRFRGARVYPSYLQAGAAYFIEASKRRMIAEDIAAAMAHAGITGLA
jgi:uracil-DNA glycosylase